MNILLIYPEFPDTFWSFKHALEFVGKRAALPPLGLLTVASMLPQEWSKRLVDTNVRALTKKDLAWADCAFISAMVVQRESARRVIARCKEAGLRIVAGGPLFQIEHEQFEAVDHFILNEAELTLPAFLKDLAQGKVERIYSSAQYADLQQTPQPLWELLDLKRYSSMSIQFSRGCPFNCDFCNVTALLGHRVRNKTSRQIIAELDSLYAHGWRDDVFFVDDNFIGNKPFLKNDLLPALIEWRKGKTGLMFFTEASINLADDRTLDGDDGARPDSTGSSSASRPRTRIVWPSAARSRTGTATSWRTSNASSEPGCRCWAGLSSDLTTIGPPSSSGRSSSFRRAAL